MEEQVFRVPEVARRLAMDGIAVYGLIERGELRAGKRGGAVVVPESAIREFEERKAQTSK
ncbi:MAG: helix-turn-helix domain-containing protein [Actinobacteria bacterium]|nr:helix-turn-helix domain-containing protein [Actinomycetota bacterium]